METKGTINNKVNDLWTLFIRWTFPPNEKRKKTDNVYPYAIRCVEYSGNLLGALLIKIAAAIKAGPNKCNINSLRVPL